MTNHASVAKTVFQSQFPNSTVSAEVLKGNLTIEVRDRAGALVVVSSRPITQTAKDREQFEAELFTTAKRLKEQVIESRGLTVRDVPVQERPKHPVRGAL